VFAQYVTLPTENVVEIPGSIEDDRAIFIEPLAAALEILEQVTIDRRNSVLLLGDGKLGMLIAHVLQTTGCRLVVAGRHEQKWTLLRQQGIAVTHVDRLDSTRYDIVIEASGNPEAFACAVSHTKPRGTLVLKSTYAGMFPFNPAPIVVDEITVIGSRCGRFSTAIEFLRTHDIPLERMITATMPLSQAREAFAVSEKPESIKVVLDMIIG
jgi:2-desacetyl-2-hydroxyethyl bacteriochlorophyllide A dehydrogenase